jgi:hypothetical protein
VRAHGFTAEQLAELVYDGFVTKTTERRSLQVSGPTRAGRLALTGFLKRALP